MEDKTVRGDVEQLLNTAVTKVTASADAWMRFLKASSYTAHMGFENQLLVYEQKPDAVICTTFAYWRERLYRKIRPGENGITIFSRGAVGQVYDLSQTDETPESRMPFLWNVHPIETGSDAPITEALRKAYQVREKRFVSVLYQAAAAETDKVLSGASDNLKNTLHPLVANSIFYSVLGRCEIDVAVDPEPFQRITDYKERAALARVGRLYNAGLQNILRVIKSETLDYKEEKERSGRDHDGQSESRTAVRGGHLANGGGVREGSQVAAGEHELLASGKSESAGTGDVLRTEASGLHAGGTVRGSEADALGRQSVRLSSGSGRDGNGNAGADRRETGQERSAAQQGNRSDGMGAAHEPSGSGSERLRPERDRVSVENTTENRNAEKAESDNRSAFSVEKKPLTEAEIERQRVAGQVVNFYHTLPDMVTRPWGTEARDNVYAQRDYAETLLTDTAKAEALYTAMTEVLARVSPQSRRYTLMEGQLREVRSFLDRKTVELSAPEKKVEPKPESEPVKKTPEKPQVAEKTQDVPEGQMSLWSYAASMESEKSKEPEPAENTAPIPAAPEPVLEAKTEAVYPAEKNGLPYDVVVETLHTVPEPTAPEPAKETDTLPEEDDGKKALQARNVIWKNGLDAGSFVYLEDATTYSKANPRVSVTYKLLEVSENAVRLRDITGAEVEMEIGEFERRAAENPLNSHYVMHDHNKHSLCYYKECLYMLAEILPETPVYEKMQSGAPDVETALETTVREILEENKETAPKLYAAFHEWNLFANDILLDLSVQFDPPFNGPAKQENFDFRLDLTNMHRSSEEEALTKEFWQWETTFVADNTGEVLRSGAPPRMQPELPETRAVPALAADETNYLIDMPIPGEIIDDILRSGGNKDHSVLRIVWNFMTEKSDEEAVSTIKEEYGTGGKGFVSDGARYSVWWDEDGMRIALGKFARENSITRGVLSWEAVTGRIRQLLAEGRYAVQADLDAARDRVLYEHARTLDYMIRDMGDGTAGKFFDPAMLFRHIYPECVDKLAVLLDQPDFLNDLCTRLDGFAEQYKTDRELMRCHHYRPTRVAPMFRRFNRPYRTLQAAPGWERKEYERFITDDEIDYFLRRGGSYEDGKYATYAYYVNHHTDEQKAGFLKEQYGTGGCSNALARADDSWADYEPSKGIILKRGTLNSPYAVAKLSWKEASARVQTMISGNRFLTPKDYERMPAYERKVVAGSIARFYRKMPLYIDLPYPQGNGYEPYNEELLKVLEDKDRTAALLKAMDNALSSIPSDYFEYEQRRKILTSVHAYADGSYTIYEPKRLKPMEVESRNLTVRELFERYKAPISERLQTANAYVNACKNSDRENAFLEGKAQIERIVKEQFDYGKDSQLYKLYFENVGFHNRLNEELLNETYPLLAGEPEQEQGEKEQETEREKEHITLNGRDCVKVDEWLNTEFNYTYILGKDTENPSFYYAKVTGEFYSHTLEIAMDDGKAPTREEVELRYAYYEDREADWAEAAAYAREEGLQIDSLPQSSEPASIEPDEGLDKLPTSVFVDGQWRTFSNAEDALSYADTHKDSEKPASELTAEDIKDLVCVDGEYRQHLGLGEHRFTCTINGLLDVLYYTVQRHDDGEGFTIHTERDDIWDKMPARELSRLENVLAREVEYFHYHQKIEQAETQEELKDVYYEIMDDDSSFFRAISDRVWAAYYAREKELAQNFRITDDHLAEGGAKQRYANNIAAIQTLFTVEGEDRPATAEEQEILSKYVGWGGLADAFDVNKPAWSKEYTELKELLPEKEYAAARSSVLNAHFTSPLVIRAMYEAIGNLGFSGGNILEPSMGIGNFFGCLPDSMQNSKLYGVELDPITGRIAQKLYPKAEITIAGFETTDKSDFYDLAIGNVPFGQYQVNDKKYNSLKFTIHNYFFAKALDQVRPGGVVAFVTSRYTMDAANRLVRNYLANRAEFLGAIRLPNDAFRRNAGTEVVSDIIFLKKRERISELLDPAEVGLPWGQTAETPEGFSINEYFVQHPEMILGKLELQSSQYGEQLTVTPRQDKTLAELLSEAVKNIKGKITERPFVFEDTEEPEPEPEVVSGDVLPADPTMRNFSFVLVGQKVYFQEGATMTLSNKLESALNRIRGMIELRDTTRRLIRIQKEGGSDEEIAAGQGALNTVYDLFVERFDRINTKENRTAFKDDDGYCLLCALEVLDDEGNFKCKSDIFSKRTIRMAEPVTSVDTAVEALTVSIGEKARVDLAYMEELCGKPQSVICTELSGQIFLDPATGQWEPADEYLSGNVRQKLAAAKAAAAAEPEAYAQNVEALTEVMPKDLDASEIAVRLGATWIDTEYIVQFAKELFDLSYYDGKQLKIYYSEEGERWEIPNKLRKIISPKLKTVYATSKLNGLELLELSLNLQSATVRKKVEDADGKEREVVDTKETILAQQKQDAIKEAFQDWIFQDYNRRETLVAKYNEMYNSISPRKYDGSHIRFNGMNPEIALRKHQRDAIARILYGGNTLLAHVVGAGKTFEMAAAAMESRRLGLCSKSMFVVPNHLTTQWGSEFMRLYPGANVLVTSKRDFEKDNRKKFCSRIATGDYDAVIIGASQFERIPMSVEYQERFLKEQRDSILKSIEEIERERHVHRGVGGGITIKNMVQMEKTLEKRLEELNDIDRDDLITFEELGVDRLYVDESHYFKNLYMKTKMTRVAGISDTDAKKSSDLYMKCRYLDEKTGGKGLVFATGTPVSNSMVELYTNMRYLQHDRLEEMHLAGFDSWAATFGETVTAMELNPTGQGFRAKTRFAKFFNLPELMSVFKEVADIQTKDMLALDVPDAEFVNVVCQPSEEQKTLVESLGDRAERIQNGGVDNSVDNMLCVTSDGRKLALDQRLINEALPDYEGSKVNRCVENVFQIWKDNADKKSTQLVFCDQSTPKKDGTFSVYNDVRDKLIKMGIPRNEIAFIHDYDTDEKKSRLFSQVNSGKVRVLMGSTPKLGAGTNVQKRLIALHHLDCPWRPADLEQQEGRIIRQGNENEKVQIYRYVMTGTFDSYLWQIIENKQKFISQIMTSKSPVRSAEDVDDTVLSYAEVKALTVGNPYVQEKMTLDMDVAKLKMLKAEHTKSQHEMEHRLKKTLPESIVTTKDYIDRQKKDLAVFAKIENRENLPLTVGGKRYADNKDAAEELFTHRTIRPDAPIGMLAGLPIYCQFDTAEKEYILNIKGECNHFFGLCEMSYVTIRRMQKAIDEIPLRIENAENKLRQIADEMTMLREEIGKPFPKEKELSDKANRLSELNVLLTAPAEKPGLEEGTEVRAEEKQPYSSAPARCVR